MKPNDLMIFDWVYYQGGYAQIELVGECDLRLYYNGGKSYAVTTFSSISPIPLTDEILKKNGFQYYHKNFASIGQDSPFKLEMVEWPDENGIGGLWVIKGLFKIRFVHELQHALRLCGIDINFGPK